MLRELRIRNVAIIDDLSLEFGGGLNVITGETGAGKTILLRSLGMLCGERTAADLIRSNADEAIVEGTFDFSVTGDVAEACGLDADDDAIIIRRHIHRNGKSRCYVNGAAASAAMLRDLGSQLVHIYGQHEQALLLRATSHLDYLDAFGGLQPQRDHMQRAYAELRARQRRLDDLDQRARQSAERRDLLEFQRSELTAAALQPGEEIQLRDDRERLRHAERIATVCAAGEDALYAAGDAIVARLARLSSDLTPLAAVVADLASPAELIEQGRLVLEEAALQLRAIAGHTSADPSRLDEIEARLALLSRLAKKFGVSSDDLAGVLTRVEEDLALICGDSDSRDRAAQEIAAALQRAAAAAAELSTARRAAARRLEESMARELGELGMDGGVFRAAIETSAMREIEDFAPTGADRVEFLLSANRGEAAQPLTRVASGGELSRILLALKSLTAAVTETPILIFDEVDAGIGGSVADAVARKLRTLAAGRQVLCITHLPQIAAGADNHYAVSKRLLDGRTVSETRLLDRDERIAEVARMLGGKARKEAAEYARELIAQRDTAAPSNRRKQKVGA